MVTLSNNPTSPGCETRDQFEICTRWFAILIGEIRQLVADELVEFGIQPVEVEDFRRIIDRFRGIYGIHLKFV